MLILQYIQFTTEKKMNGTQKNLKIGVENEKGTSKKDIRNTVKKGRKVLNNNNNNWRTNIIMYKTTYVAVRILVLATYKPNKTDIETEGMNYLWKGIYFWGAQHAFRTKLSMKWRWTLKNNIFYGRLKKAKNNII